MLSPHSALLTSLLLGLTLLASPARAAPPQAPADNEASRLIATFLGNTPLLSDLQSLTDEIGGRATGTQANLRSVEWALARFREAGVEARKEAFSMPSLWLERSARATVRGERLTFSPRVAAMPYSTGTPRGGMTAPLRSVGKGTDGEFA
ncbi:MAG TPA: peptidase M28, partial [Myxococcaceae bacterium]